MSPGRVVAHFETKGEIVEYLKTSGVPYTVCLTCLCLPSAPRCMCTGMTSRERFFACTLWSAEAAVMLWYARRVAHVCYLGASG